MKQETKGKIFVGMIISVLAFGFASGTGIFMGINPFHSIGVLNLTNQGEFPDIYTTPYTGKNQTNTTQPKPIQPTPPIEPVRNDTDPPEENKTNGTIIHWYIFLSVKEDNYPPVN